MTNKDKNIIDLGARLEALNISNSYAVQAPAGSGKTELLSLRFLKLLAICEHPEEVLAITFTKKAANEMAVRVLSTLEWANNVKVADLDKQLDRDRYAAAQDVLAQDTKKEWLLQQSPNRLRIQTIDSFSNYLASKLPILSRFGGPLQVGEAVDDCYSMAIQDCMNLLNIDSPISDSIAKLLLHLDNDTAKIETLLQGLLQQREQWIEDITSAASSPERTLAYLTENLLELIQESLNSAANHLQKHQHQLIPLLEYATQNLAEDGENSPLLLCTDLNELPDCNPENLSTWIALSNFLLTKNKNNPAVRKQVNKNSGFPAPTGSKEEKQLRNEMKQEMKALLVSLAESKDSLHALDYLRRLPLPDENTFSWEFLVTLTSILPTLAAQLEIAFAQKNKVDYSQVSLAALRALGDDEAPTDLALALDYQIKHILIDEFQDTSSTQMNLLNKLTAGWESNDGRTLFVVGDAMQSCYGFRNANVGLFIKLREDGLRNLNVSPINLLSNFRSDAGVVHWVNEIFSKSFPESNDISRGAVEYLESQAVHAKGLETAISMRCYQHDKEDKNGTTTAYQEEATYIAEEISKIRSENPDNKIAILVRSRAHLEFILPSLREAKIPWIANEIDKLSSLPIITDLLSLTYAICNQADRLSWLSILRAPWCGLKLEDLHLVANWNHKTSILETLCQLTDKSINSDLSEDGLLRLKHITPALVKAVTLREGNQLNRVIQSLFIKIGGQYVLRSESEQDSLNRYYELVSDNEIAGTIQDFAKFQDKVESSFVSNSPNESGSNPIQIMTIHKSKGLEFDHVFLPGLAKASRSDEKSLLLWHQRLNHQGDEKTFLATLSATGSDDNSLYNLLRFEKSEKSRFESTRLLYIAVTRAIQSVYLSATLSSKEGETTAPGSRTLLNTIWEGVLASPQSDSWLQFIPVASSSVATLLKQDPLTVAPTLSRLPSKLISELQTQNKQSSDPSSTRELEKAVETQKLELSGHNELQIQIGNLLHESLQAYLSNPKILEPANFSILECRWAKHLLNFNFSNDEICSAQEIIRNSLLATTASNEINWIFDNTLQQSAAELAMQSYSEGIVRNHILDRTFIDKQGQRWIVDYKSTVKPEHKSLTDFLSEEMERYRGQLSRYRSLFSEESNNGIKTALLFTSLPKLVEY